MKALFSFWNIRVTISGYERRSCQVFGSDNCPHHSWCETQAYRSRDPSRPKYKSCSFRHVWGNTLKPNCAGACIKYCNVCSRIFSTSDWEEVTLPLPSSQGLLKASLLQIWVNILLQVVFFQWYPLLSSKHKIKSEYQDWYPPKSSKFQPVSNFHKKKV